MTSGGCQSCQSANLSANTDFPVAKALIIGSFIAITIGFIVFIAFLMVYLFCQIYGLMDISTTDTTTTAAASTTTTTSTSAPATSSCHVGINPEVIASVPVFVYSSSSRKEKIECAICLMEIKNGEKGRLLSRCGHGFHAECIDMWLHSHSTCPLCRSNVGSEFTEPPI